MTPHGIFPYSYHNQYSIYIDVLPYEAFLFVPFKLLLQGYLWALEREAIGDFLLSAQGFLGTPTTNAKTSYMNILTVLHVQYIIILSVPFWNP